MSDNMRGRGLPTDHITKRIIGQTALYFMNLIGAVDVVSYFNPLPCFRVRDIAINTVMSAGVTLTNVATVKIADANPNRKFFRVCTNGDSKPVWIKLQAASVDDDKKGIWIERRAGSINFWEMQPDKIYTGEISAIADSVDVDVFTTEY